MSDVFWCVRACGSFDLQTGHGRVQGISHRFCTPVHRADYLYARGTIYARSIIRLNRKAQPSPA
jgi:hypothetical protein